MPLWAEDLQKGLQKMVPLLSSCKTPLQECNDTHSIRDAHESKGAHEITETHRNQWTTHETNKTHEAHDTIK